MVVSVAAVSIAGTIISSMVFGILVGGLAGLALGILLNK